jgi:hypothetical protein
VSAPRRLLIKAAPTRHHRAGPRQVESRMPQARTARRAPPVQPKCSTHALRAVAKLAKAIAQPRAPVMTRLLVQPGDMRECRRS